MMSAVVVAVVAANDARSWRGLLPLSKAAVAAQTHGGDDRRCCHGIVPQSLLRSGDAGHCGAPGGCGAMVHVWRRWMGLYSPGEARVLAQLEFANAFNSVERPDVLAAREAGHICGAWPPRVDWTSGSPLHRIQLRFPAGRPARPLAVQHHFHRVVSHTQLRAPAERPWPLDTCVF